jgi:hypothetical protein
LGWAEELDKNEKLHPLTSHTLVRKPQELTDRIWSNIKLPLVEIMKELKEKRLVAERLATLKKRQLLVVSLLKTYTLEQPVTALIPGPADVCNMDDFKAVIENPNYVEVTKETFKEAMDRLPQLIDDWRVAKDAELVCILNKQASGSHLKESSPVDNRALLELATTSFRCRICSSTILYPRILVHSCTHSLRLSWRDYDDSHSILCRNIDDEPWNFAGDRVSVDEQGKIAANLVVRSCGLDPSTTSASEMDDLDARFECTVCSNVHLGRLVMGWTAAVCHLTSFRRLLIGVV